MKMKSSKPYYILSLLLLFFLSSCSMHLAKYSILSNQEINIKKTDGINVTGKADTFLSSLPKLMKEATTNALKKAGPEYDILVNVVIDYKIGILRSTVIVTGTAYKSKDLINK